MMLSIVTPFFNSSEKCVRLLERFSQIKRPGVELIFVNDGSTDNTLPLLNEFSHKAQARVKVLTQNNKGPGGARNTGLISAEGEYVWFVDSDDDINLTVIEVLSVLMTKRYDFIDFDYLCKGKSLNSMTCSVGEYVVDAKLRKKLLHHFGRLCTKVFRRQWLENNTIVYPEYCIYEDNALLFFCPLMVNKFYKSDVLGYIHHEDYPSVTRSDINWRYFDRMHTALAGLSKGMELASEDEKTILTEKFIRIYLISTLRKLTNRGEWKPNLAVRVMRQYRVVSRTYHVETNPIPYMKGSFRRKSICYLLWLVSYFLPEQTDYFENIRSKAWDIPMDLYKASL